jgi:biopolymer transport protein ExbD
MDDTDIADRDTRHPRIAEVMAEANRAGRKRIGPVTDPGADK